MNAKTLKPLAFLLVIMVMASLACIIFTPSPTQQAPINNPPVTNPPVNDTPAPPVDTPVPPQQSTPEASPTSAPSGEQFFTEEFNGDISANWLQTIELNATDGDKSQAKISVDNGYLVFDFGKNLIGYEFYKPYTYKNVRIDIRVDNRGTNVNDVLLVCRASDEGHYLVNVANSGLFAIYAYDGTKKTYARIADGGSNKIKSGKEVNDYSLVCNDKTLILYINGSQVRSYTDNQYVFREGMVGVGVASEDLVPVKLEFDWVKISQP